MRFALTPKSLPPTRDSERMSTMLCCASGVTRITMSSLKPKSSVVGAGRAFGALEGLFGRHVQHLRRDVRVSLLLRCRRLRLVVDRIARVLSERHDGDECRRVVGVGGDVVNGRQALRLAVHVERWRGDENVDDQRGGSHRQAAPLACDA